MFNGVNLANLGGDTPAQKTKNIALALFTTEKLGKKVIDPRKQLNKCSQRVPADEYRTELYRKAVRVALGQHFTTDLYRNTLRLVNQMGVDKSAKPKQNKVETNYP